jgi:PKD repeat protein
MPLEGDQVPDFKADWSFSLIENRERTVAFRDESVGAIESWHWDFGNGDFSTEQHPLYQYPESGVHYNVTLEIMGVGKTDRKTRFWEVMIP